MSMRVYGLWNATLLVAVGGCIAILVIDTGGSLVSRSTGMNYGYFAILSFAIYAGVGILAAHLHSSAAAAVAGFLVSALDATVGWWISWQIGPGRVNVVDKHLAIVLATTGIFVVSLDTAIATAAGAIWRKRLSARNASRSAAP